MLFRRSYNRAIDYVTVTLFAFIVDLSLSDPTISTSVLFFLALRPAFSSNFQMEGIGLTLSEGTTSLHVHIRVVHISVCGSQWSHSNSNNTLTASYFSYQLLMCCYMLSDLKGDAENVQNFLINCDMISFTLYNFNIAPR